MAKARPAPRGPILRTVLFATGMFLILASPLVGLLLGPGGVFVLAAGLVLALRNSRWARYRFARWKRRWPRLGAIADRALRRRSAQRRRARRVAGLR